MGHSKRWVFWQTATSRAMPECEVLALTRSGVTLRADEALGLVVGSRGYVTRQKRVCLAEVVAVEGTTFEARFVSPGREFLDIVNREIDHVAADREGPSPWSRPRVRPPLWQRPLFAAYELIERRCVESARGRTVFDIDEFPGVRELVARAPEMRSEVAELIRTYGVAKMPEVVDNAGSYVKDAWRTYPVRFSESLSKRCPVTAKAVAAVPNTVKRSEVFSLLMPGQEIIPHRAIYSAWRLRLHIGLVVPPGDCGLFVDGQIIRWKELEAFVFDDTVVHSAWNKTDEVRAILMVDLVRPMPKMEWLAFRALRQLKRVFDDDEPDEAPGYERLAKALDEVDREQASARR